MHTRNGLQQKPAPTWRVLAFSLVIPLFIALAGTLFYATVRAATSGEADVHRLLEDVRNGSSSKRWQSAYQLSRILQDPAHVAQDPRFVSAMLATFAHTALEHNPSARQYMALAMGRAGNRAFAPALLGALESDPPENQLYLVRALGLIGDARAAAAVAPFAQDASVQVRLETVIALGAMGDPQMTDVLAGALEDSEPNVRWDAAIGLAKLADARGKAVLLQLLDRPYLAEFESVDPEEANHVLVTAARAASLLKDPEIDATIARLAENDSNMKVRIALAKLKGGGGR